MDAKTMTMPNGDVINLKDDVARAKIGTGTLDTESKELIGAVNELKQSLDNTNHDIIIKDNAKYIRGEFSIDNTTYDTYLKKIQKFISDIVTNGYDTKFDVLLLSDRRYDFSGSVYPAKDYGSGIFHNYQGVLMLWIRSNNTDTLYNITKTNA